MILQFASDLHLEFSANAEYIQKHPLEPCADTLILAGDITYLNDKYLSHSIFDQWSRDYKEVYIVPGNHEFYGKHFPVSGVFPYLNIEVRSNIRYLNNQTIYLGGIRILFTTLFSHINKEKSLEIEYYIRDFHGTRYSEDSMLPLTINQFNQCHQDCLAYLKSEMDKPFYGKTVIVSHFAPFNKKWIKDYPFFPHDFSAFFHADLEWMCESYKIDHWISGHTHIHFESFKICNTWMSSNMMGYVERSEHQKFNNQKLIET
ncbi:MAG: metallophosphoesterase [Cyclobacteriaceae bacterium]